MDGCGKSDSPIVPKKTSNNGVERSVSAERLEGRGLAKGNVQEQTRLRTQSRARLQSELARIRQRWRHYLRQEPGAVVPHAGICAGG